MVGVKGEALQTNPNIHPGNAYMIGVYGIASGALYGKNYGIFGILNDEDSNGAGIYGSNDITTIQPLSSQYAGYFHGNTEVNGTLYYTQSQVTSDERLKTNINTINANALQKLNALHPVQFQWQQIDDVITDDTIILKTPHFSKDIDFNKKHYGLLAQEVQKIFPELVEKTQMAI